jgi:hypothetical protein
MSEMEIFRQTSHPHHLAGLRVKLNSRLNPAFVCSTTTHKLYGSRLNRLNWLPFKDHEHFSRAVHSRRNCGSGLCWVSLLTDSITR